MCESSTAGTGATPFILLQEIWHFLDNYYLAGYTYEVLPNKTL